MPKQKKNIAVRIAIPPKLLLGAFLVLGSVGLTWFALGPKGLLDAHYIEVLGVDRLSPDVVRATAEEALSGSTWGISKKSLLIARPQRLARDLESKIPRIEDAHVVPTVSPAGFRIRVKERELAALWCVGEGNEVSLVEAKRCFAADASGILFDDAPKSEGALVLSIIDVTRTEANFGESVYSPDEYHGMVEVREILKDIAGVLVVRMIRAGEREFLAETAQRWAVIVDPTDNIARQAGALREVLAQTITPEERLTLEYIDVRTPGKVFYK